MLGMRLRGKTEQTQENEYVIVVGCGRLGASLAEAVSDRGGDVVVIDRDKEAFGRLYSGYGGLTMAADATNIDVLMEARIDRATAVVAVTDSDSVNLMVSQMAKEIFKKKKVICRLYDPERACVYEGTGIETICPARLSEAAIEQMIETRGPGFYTKNGQAGAGQGGFTVREA